MRLVQSSCRAHSGFHFLDSEVGTQNLRERATLRSLARELLRRRRLCRRVTVSVTINPRRIGSVRDAERLVHPGRSGPRRA